jgi:hypothetical protein
MGRFLDRQFHAKPAQADLAVALFGIAIIVAMEARR